MTTALEVLVIFHCRTGETEHQALAAALGAVQARATIRLRRLADVAGDSSGSEALARMRQEYVPPAEADLLRADAIIVAAPPEFTGSAPEWTALFDLLSRLGSDGKLRNKLALACCLDAKACSALIALLQNAGLVVMDTAARDPVRQGRDLTTHAGALKEARSGA